MRSTLILLAGGATLALIGLLYVRSLWGEIAAYEAEIASQARSIATLTDAAEQAREARRLEAIRAAQAEARARELQGKIETILTGDFADAPLDPALADFLNGVSTGQDN